MTRKPTSRLGRFRNVPTAKRSSPVRCSDSPVQARRSPASCLAPSFAPATWPTTFSIATSIRNGMASEREWSIRFPTNETLWQRYAEIRAEGLRAGDGGAAGTEFYRENRAAMDEGADVAWAERFNHDELSAIQHAMNLKLQDEAAFFAEYQNEPLPEETRRRRSTDRRASRREDQRHAATLGPDRRQSSHRVHRRPTETAVLRRRRLGRRLHRLRRRLRNLSRSEATVLHAPRRATHAGDRSEGTGLEGSHLRRSRIADHRSTRPRMAT